MRLLQIEADGDFSLGEYVGRDIPRYAILSHRWGADHEEVTFRDFVEGTGKSKAGYRKLAFCGKQAANDGLRFFWIDTCCIDKASSAELSEAINSMFRWYQHAESATYTSPMFRPVASPETSSLSRGAVGSPEDGHCRSLLPPYFVEFFSSEGDQIGDKSSMVQEIYNITRIPIQALQGTPLAHFSVDERMSWTENRETKREEDAAYCLLGIFDIHMPLLYGEGRKKAFSRLQKGLKESSEDDLHALSSPALCTEQPGRKRDLSRPCQAARTQTSCSDPIFLASLAPI
ncbi:heterokaryon incompatibility protein-domain-containing protein [Phaeosphaeriaceae sp. PMI808]|nr:heterokaryon incompatibility protein-domain-containing protein [Phaeosphaeriaceae sp. PMI808]